MDRSSLILTGLAMVDWHRLCNDEDVFRISSYISGIAVVTAVSLIILSIYEYAPETCLHIGFGMLLLFCPVLLWCMYKRITPFIRRCLGRFASFLRGNTHQSPTGRFELDDATQDVELANLSPLESQRAEPSTVAKQTNESASDYTGEPTPLLVNVRQGQPVETSLERMNKLKIHLEEFIASMMETDKTVESTNEAVRKFTSAWSIEGASTSTVPVQDAERCGPQMTPIFNLVAEIQKGVDAIIRLQKSKTHETVRRSRPIKIPWTSDEQRLFKLEEHRLRTKNHDSSSSSSDTITDEQGSTKLMETSTEAFHDSSSSSSDTITNEQGSIKFIETSIGASHDSSSSSDTITNEQGSIKCIETSTEASHDSSSSSSDTITDERIN